MSVAASPLSPTGNIELQQFLFVFTAASGMGGPGTAGCGSVWSGRVRRCCAGRCGSTRCGVCRAGSPGSGAGCAIAVNFSVGANSTVAVRCRSSGVLAACRRAAAIVTACRCFAAATAIAASAGLDKAVTAPAVSIAPTSPRTHAKEDAVVEVAGTVEAHGRAGIGCVIVVAVRAYRLNADANDDLGRGGRREGYACQQCRSTENGFESAHGLTPLRCLRLPEVREMLLVRNESLGNRRHHKDSVSVRRVYYLDPYASKTRRHELEYLSSMDHGARRMRVCHSLMRTVGFLQCALTEIRPSWVVSLQSVAG